MLSQQGGLLNGQSDLDYWLVSTVKERVSNSLISISKTAGGKFSKRLLSYLCRCVSS